MEVPKFTFPMDISAGYHIFNDEAFIKQYYGRVYEVFNSIICDEIEKNNLLCVNGLIRWLDVVCYFPDNQLMFEHAYKYGSYEMFLMIYYICLFWGNENDYQTYLEYQHIKTLKPLKDEEKKNDYINSFYHQYGKFKLGMDDVAKAALLNTDDEDELSELEFEKFEQHFKKALLSCDNHWHLFSYHK